MTREDLDTVGKLTDDQLALLTCVELRSLEAMIAQGNAADARVEELRRMHDEALVAKDSEKAKLIADHNTVVDAKTVELTAANAKIAAFEADELLPTVKTARKKKRRDELEAKKAKAIKDKADAVAELAAL